MEQARRQVEHIAKINRWLNPANTHDDQQSHLAGIMPDSCNWVVSEPMLTALLSSSGSSTIIIQGLPGSGKTMVMSFLVDYMSTNVDSKVLFFFCKANEPEKHDALQVLRTLAWELLQLLPDFYDNLEPWYSESGRIILDSYSELQQMCQHYLRRCYRSTDPKIPKLIHIIAFSLAADAHIHLH
ncbi:hypothetical protein GJ744_005333 [Endocarpon pusillum]|uniref:Nephrocystin 3-like N-terminal domain-containing protein n=1 Tax=Endocarpon pusillum TaxID=364733 RepID=A0A8H7AQH1_9EURO|nr:hypothetical protein GJ744_005333 [Endocarpon pusillum]